jgi:peptidyl-prolyl cis-trans isomerase SurA
MRKFGTAILITILTISIATAQTSKPDTSKAKAATVVAVPAKADTTTKIATGPHKTLDKIAGVVGSSIILQSDIELQYAN